MRTSRPEAASYEQEHAFAPGEDEHGYAAAEAGWDDEQAYGEAYEEGARGRSGGARAGAPASAVAGGGHRSGRGRRPRHRGRGLPAPVPHVGGAVPELLQHRWARSPTRSAVPRAGLPREGTPVTRSCPHDPMRWATRSSSAPPTGGAAPAASSPPHRRTRWGCMSSRRTRAPTPRTDALKGAIAVLVPDGVTWAPTHRQLTIGGSPADELEGVVSGPGRPHRRAFGSASTSCSRPPAAPC